MSDSKGRLWQYHNRSDRHSKIACWCVVYDLLLDCPLLRRHVEDGKITFGINHDMRDFEQNRKKNLDLVLCSPATNIVEFDKTKSLSSLTDHYGVLLDPEEKERLESLPNLARSPVGSVVVALEAKACMTAHQKARPRLYDELNSSHLTVHGAAEHAIAAGFVMINSSERFVSPTKGPPPNRHDQPRATKMVIEKVTELPRRSHVKGSGFDALAIVVVACANDGSKVELIETGVAPPPEDTFHYGQMIRRLAAIYSSRFADL